MQYSDHNQQIVQVSFGSNCKFVQEVAAINTNEKHCCTVGEISKRAVITPDIGCLLGSANKMEEYPFISFP